MMKRAVGLVSFFVMLLVACTEKFKLISYSDDGDEDAASWVLAKPAREPANATEEIAVTASEERSAVQKGALSAIFLESHGGHNLVAAFEANPRDDGLYAPKRFQFFLVTKGLITAHSQSVHQPAPDCEFVRAMHAAALAAVRSYNPVLLYDNDRRPVTLSGKRLGKCLVRVDVYDGNNSDGRPLFSNTQNVCLDIRER